MAKVPGTRCALLGTVILACGAVYFLFTLLIRRDLEYSLLSSALMMAAWAVVLALIVPRQRRTMRRLAQEGRVVCWVRHPDAPTGSSKRSWEKGIATPVKGILIFQPVLGQTTMARGEASELRITAGPEGPGRRASRWDRFNRLGLDAVVLRFPSAAGPVEVAGPPETVEAIASVVVA